MSSAFRITILALLLVGLCAGIGQSEEKKKDDDKAAEKPAEEKRAVVKARVTVRGGVVGNAAAQNEAMQKQFEQQYRPILISELAFIRQICDLKPEQRPKIKASGEEGVKKAAKGFVDRQQRQMRGVVFGVAENSDPDPRTIISESLAKALHETLSAEQMVRYTDEQAKRRANRKRAGVMCLVAQLDAALYLTGEQRDKIGESLSSHWKDKWEQAVMMQQFGNNYFPQIPDQYVVPPLTDAQKSVWRSLQKVDFGFFGGAIEEDQEDDNWWGDKPKKPVEAGQDKP